MAQERSVKETVSAVGAAARREVTGVARAARGRDEAGWSAPTWCTGWTVREVVAHLAEGVERFGMQVRGGLAGDPVEFTMADREARRQVVKALPDDELLSELKRRTGAFFDYLDTLPESELTRVCIPMAAGPAAPASVAVLRLQEPALHYWDILALEQTDATLDFESAALLADYVIGNAPRQTKPDALADLNATYSLDASGPGGGPVTITCADGKATVSRGGSAAADLTLTTEALVRLLWGRVDIERALASGQLRGNAEAARTLGRVFGNR